MLTTTRPNDRLSPGERLAAKPYRKRPSRREPRRQPKDQPPAPARMRSVLDRIPGVANLSPDEIRDKLRAGWVRAELGKTPNGREFLRCLNELVDIDCLATVSAIAVAGAERADKCALQKYTAARAGTGRVDDQTAGWEFRKAHARLERAQARHAGLQERRNLAGAELQLAGRWL